MTNKPKWEKPKLVVLVRGDSQERVLIVCKIPDPAEGQGPGGYINRCWNEVVPGTARVELCEQIVSS